MAKIKHYKTATEWMLNETNYCCKAWITAVNSISVIARDFQNPQEKIMAQTLQKVMQNVLGNYCPSCGKKL